MKYLHCGEFHIPAIGLGTWMLTGATCRQVVLDALELGYRHIDTAEVFGNEPEIAKAIAESKVTRGEIWISSKLWRTSLSKQGAWDACLTIIDRLQTDYIDHLMIHWPNANEPLAQTLEAMAELLNEGLVSTLGVSNFSPSLLSEALRLAPISAVQMEYHPYLHPTDVLEIAQREQLVTIAASPLARGRVRNDPSLTSIAQQYGKSPAQVVLRWLLQKPNVAAVPKSQSSQHLRENISLFDFALSDELVERIDAIHHGHQRRLVNPNFAPAWNA